MRKLITIYAAVLLTANVFAQSPQKMSYQAVIRNSSNTLIINKDIAMQTSILQGSISGTAVYVETQTPTTNANGLVSIEIGGGTVVSGNFSTINWANGPYFVKTETDPDGVTGGISYTITGTSQLLSVPYALFAKKSGDSLAHTNSGNSSELINSLPVTTGTPYIMKVIYSQQLNNIKINEVIQTMCEYEVTNDLGFNVMIGTVILLADSPTATTGIEITEANAFNVTPGMHHGVIVKVGSYDVTANYPSKYINVVGYAAGNAASSGDTIKVEQDYGRLSVFRFFKN
jgi:hypothetical protein